MALDSANPPAEAGPVTLNPLAVLAFCAEMARLFNHWLLMAEPDLATKQTVPSMPTMVAYMLKPNPPFLSGLATTVLRADCSCDQVIEGQLAAITLLEPITKAMVTNNFFFIGIISSVFD